MGNDQTIEYLQKALQMELTAAHQYQLHAHILDDWGLGILAGKMRGEMAEEIGHSDAFIERILFLNGTPDLAFQKKPEVAASLEEMFKADLADEEDAIAFYTKAARHAADVGDIGSRTLFEGIVMDEEGHKAWLELQLSLLGRIGEAAYTVKYMSTGAVEEDSEG